MDIPTKNGKIRSLSNGANQSGVRNYNERLLLSMLLRYGSMPGSDLARHSGLSSQTVSVIFRKLEKYGLIERGKPVKGKVGKPSIPMRLAADGVFSFGIHIGMNETELILIDLQGTVRKQRNLTYSYPLPDQIFPFLEASIAEIQGSISKQNNKKIIGIGVAIAFELWKWYELVGASKEEFSIWESVNFKQEISSFSELPVFPVNDSTAACRAEHVYGRGKEYRDYAYFFISTLIGGGIVLNHSVFEGNQANAGALGSLRSIGPDGETRQLIDMASIHLLEKRLTEVNIDPDCLVEDPENWETLKRYVDPWIRQTSEELAKASLSTCSVLDFEAILIDGAFPKNIKTAIVEQTRRYIATQDTRGLIPPEIKAAEIGKEARAIGAATGPIFSQLFLNMNAVFPEI